MVDHELRQGRTERLWWKREEDILEVETHEKSINLILLFGLETFRTMEDH